MFRNVKMFPKEVGIACRVCKKTASVVKEERFHRMNRDKDSNLIESNNFAGEFKFP